MPSDSERLNKLLEYVRSEGRICPVPQQWQKLYELLPDKKRRGGGWEPALPLILAAWWEATNVQKIERLKNHVEYAAANGVLDDVETFLRGLPLAEWHRVD